MAAEGRAVDNDSNVIIESQAVENVIAVDNVPVDYFVAAADVPETVVVSTDNLDSEISAVSGANSAISHQNMVSIVKSEVKVEAQRPANIETERGLTPMVPASEVESSKDDEKVVEVKVIPIEMLYDGTLWSQFDLTKASDTGDEDIFVSESANAPLSDGVSEVARQVEVTTRSDNMSLSIRDIHKREKDRQKKRVLRADPVFREKEKQKAKERMQSRRLNPMYREQERQRDRERRQLARRRNHSLREKERERDKQYKKQYRYGNRPSTCGVSEQTDQCKTVDSLPCEVFLDFSSANS